MSEETGNEEGVIEETTETTDGGGGEVTETGGDDPPGGEEGQTQEPAYEPNFNYKVYDQEHQFPELLRGVVTDKDSEEAVRSLLCKAGAIDPMKEKLSEFQSQRDEALGKVDQLTQGLRELDHYAKTDIGAFLRSAKIPMDKVVDYVGDFLKAQENPEAARAFASRTDDVVSGFRDITHRESLESENRNLIQRQHNFEMETVMARPEVKAFAEQFDAIAGKEGTFMERVSEYGSFVYQSSRGQNYVSPTNAVQHVMNQLGAFVTAAGQNNGAAAADTESGGGGEKPATIPNVGAGRGVSPTRKKFKTLDDLKKHVQEVVGG